ncbi:MAG: hypothetical protein FVQ79_00550 [Planctomycetes bacterium]|nr:hypothetical protein [Planctomycetota bacterium]
MKKINKNSVLNALSNHIGKHRGVRARRLVYEITDRPSTHCAERQLREVIVELRNEGQHICGHPGTGYFIAANDKELNETCQFLYGRSMTGLKQIARMKKVAVPDLKGQLRLQT